MEPTESTVTPDAIRKNRTWFTIYLNLCIPFALSRLVLALSLSLLLHRFYIFTCLLCTLFRIKTHDCLDCDSTCKPQSGSAPWCCAWQKNMHFFTLWESSEGCIVEVAYTSNCRLDKPLTIFLYAVILLSFVVAH